MSQNRKGYKDQIKIDGFEERDHGNTIKHARRKNEIIKELDKVVESNTFSEFDASSFVKIIVESQDIPRSTAFRSINEILHQGIEDEYDHDDPLIETNDTGIYKLLSQTVAENLDSRNRLFPHFALRELFENNLTNPILPNNLTNPFFPYDSSPTKVVSSLIEDEKRTFNQILNYKGDLSKETKFLLEFSLKIGLYITYLLLKTIKPQSGDKDKEEKIAESFSRITNSILPSSFLFYFMKQDIIRKNLKIYQSRYKSRRKTYKETSKKNNLKDTSNTSNQLDKKGENQESISIYEISEDAYLSLEQGIKTIWPFTYILFDHLQKQENLTKVLKELVKSTEKQKYMDRRKKIKT